MQNNVFQLHAQYVTAPQRKTLWDRWLRCFAVPLQNPRRTGPSQSALTLTTKHPLKFGSGFGSFTPLCQHDSQPHAVTAHPDTLFPFVTPQVPSTNYHALRTSPASFSRLCPIPSPLKLKAEHFTATSLFLVLLLASPVHTRGCHLTLQRQTKRNVCCIREHRDWEVDTSVGLCSIVGLMEAFRGFSVYPNKCSESALKQSIAVFFHIIFN